MASIFDTNKNNSTTAYKYDPKNAGLQSLSQAVKNARLEVYDPSLNYTEDFNNAYIKAKLVKDFGTSLYRNTGDPREEQNKELFSQFVQTIYPNANSSYVKANYKNYIRDITGHDMDATSFMDNWVNKVGAGFQMQLASLSQMLHLIGSVTDNKNYITSIKQTRENDWDEYLDKATNYKRTDYFDEYYDTWYEKVMNNFGDFLPSSIVSTTLGIAGSALGMPALGAGVSGIYNALVEGGGLALDLREAGADELTQLAFGGAYGVQAGLLEFSGDLVENGIFEPILNLFSKTMGKTATSSLRKTLKQVAKEYGKKYMTNLFTEPMEETLQDFSSMWYNNMALKYEEEHKGKKFSDKFKYTPEQIKEALKETALSTFRGQLIGGVTQSFLSGVADLSKRKFKYKDANGVTHEFTQVGNIRAILEAQKVTKDSDNAILVNSGQILSNINKGDSSKYKIGKQSDTNHAIKAVKIGGTYIPIGEDSEYASWAIGHSDAVYVDVIDSVDSSDANTVKPSEIKYIVSNAYKDELDNIEFTEDGDVIVKDKTKLNEMVKAFISSQSNIIGVNNLDNGIEVVFKNKNGDLYKQSFFTESAKESQSFTIDEIQDEYANDIKSEAIENFKRKQDHERFEKHSEMIEYMQSKDSDALFEEEKNKVTKGMSEEEAKKTKADMDTAFQNAYKVIKSADRKKRNEAVGIHFIKGQREKAERAYAQGSATISYYFAKASGKDYGEFVKNMTIICQPEVIDSATGKKVRANIEHSADGSNVIRLSYSYNATSLAHEISHVFLFSVGEENWEKMSGFADNFANELKADRENLEEERKQGKAYWRTQEAFASEFETYLASGLAKDTNLRAMFNNLWLGVKSMYITERPYISDKIRAMFDTIFDVNNEGVSTSDSTESADSTTQSMNQDYPIGAIRRLKDNELREKIIKKYNTAVEAYKNGEPDLLIYEHTGWLKGTDDVWYYYIPDDYKYVNDEKLKSILMRFAPDEHSKISTDKWNAFLSEIYTSDFIKDIFGSDYDNVSLDFQQYSRDDNGKIDENVLGQYDSANKTITLFVDALILHFNEDVAHYSYDRYGTKSFNEMIENNSFREYVASVLVHEVQHFAQGELIYDFKGADGKKYKLYYRDTFIEQQSRLQQKLFEAKDKGVKTRFQDLLRRENKVGGATYFTEPFRHTSNKNTSMLDDRGFHVDIYEDKIGELQKNIMLSEKDIEHWDKIIQLSNDFDEIDKAMRDISETEKRIEKWKQNVKYLGMISDRDNLNTVYKVKKEYESNLSFIHTLMSEGDIEGAYDYCMAEYGGILGEDFRNKPIVMEEFIDATKAEIKEDLRYARIQYEAYKNKVKEYFRIHDDVDFGDFGSVNDIKYPVQSMNQSFDDVIGDGKIITEDNMKSYIEKIGKYKGYSINPLGNKNNPYESVWLKTIGSLLNGGDKVDIDNAKDLYISKITSSNPTDELTRELAGDSKKLKSRETLANVYKKYFDDLDSLKTHYKDGDEKLAENLAYDFRKIATLKQLESMIKSLGLTYQTLTDEQVSQLLSTIAKQFEDGHMSNMLEAEFDFDDDGAGVNSVMRWAGQRLFGQYGTYESVLDETVETAKEEPKEELKEDSGEEPKIKTVKPVTVPSSETVTETSDNTQVEVKEESVEPKQEEPKQEVKEEKPKRKYTRKKKEPAQQTYEVKEEIPEVKASTVDVDEQPVVAKNETTIDSIKAKLEDGGFLNKDEEEIANSLGLEDLTATEHTLNEMINKDATAKDMLRQTIKYYKGKNGDKKLTDADYEKIWGKFKARMEKENPNNIINVKDGVWFVKRFEAYQGMDTSNYTKLAQWKESFTGFNKSNAVKETVFAMAKQGLINDEDNPYEQKYPACAFVYRTIKMYEKYGDRPYVKDSYVNDAVKEILGSDEIRDAYLRSKGEDRQADFESNKVQVEKEANLNVLLSKIIHDKSLSKDFKDKILDVIYGKSPVGTIDTMLEEARKGFDTSKSIEQLNAELKKLNTDLGIYKDLLKTAEDEKTESVELINKYKKKVSSLNAQIKRKNREIEHFKRAALLEVERANLKEVQKELYKVTRKYGDSYSMQNIMDVYNALMKPVKDNTGSPVNISKSLDGIKRSFVLNGETIEKTYGELIGLKDYLLKNGIIDEKGNLLKNFWHLTFDEIKNKTDNCLLETFRTEQQIATKTVADIEGRKIASTEESINKFFDRNRRGDVFDYNEDGTINWTEEQQENIDKLMLDVSEDGHVLYKGLTQEEAERRVKFMYYTQTQMKGSAKSKASDNTVKGKIKSATNKFVNYLFKDAKQVLSKFGIEDIIFGTDDDSIRGLYHYDRDSKTIILNAQNGLSEFIQKQFGIKKNEVEYFIRKCSVGGIKIGELKAGDDYYDNVPEYSKDLYKYNDSGFAKDTDFTMQDLMGIYIYQKQKHGLLRLLVGNGLTRGQITWVNEQFETNPEYANYKALCDYMIREMGSRFAQVAEVLFRTKNLVLKMYKFYYPLYDGDFSMALTLDGDSAIDTDIIISQSNSSGKEWFDIEHVKDSMTKERTGSYNALNLSVLGSYLSAVEMQANYIAGAEIFERIDNFWNGTAEYGKGRYKVPAKDLIREKYGEDAEKFVLDFINTVKGVKTPKSSIDNAISFFRNNRALSKLAYNMSSLLQQPSSLFLGLEKYSMKQLMSSLEVWRQNGNAFRQIVESKSSLMAMRNNANIEFAKGTFANKYFENEKDLKRKTIVKKFTENGLKWMESVDKNIADVLWYTAYTDNKNQDMKESKAIKLADEWVMRIQSSKDPIYNSLAYSSDNPILRMSFMFTNQLNKHFNIITNAMATRNAKKIWRAMYGISMANLWCIAVTAKWKPDDDEEDFIGYLKQIAEQMGIEWISVLPKGNDIKSIFEGWAYQTEDDLVSTSSALIKDVKDIFFTDEKDKAVSKSYTKLKNVIYSIEDLTGLPSVATKRTLQSIESLYDDDSSVWQFIAPWLGGEWKN